MANGQWPMPNAYDAMYGYHLQYYMKLFRLCPHPQPHTITLKCIKSSSNFNSILRESFFLLLFSNMSIQMGNLCLIQQMYHIFMLNTELVICVDIFPPFLFFSLHKVAVIHNWACWRICNHLVHCTPLESMSENWIYFPTLKLEHRNVVCMQKREKKMNSWQFIRQSSHRIWYAWERRVSNCILHEATWCPNGFPKIKN